VLLQAAAPLLLLLADLTFVDSSAGLLLLESSSSSELRQNTIPSLMESLTNKNCPQNVVAPFWQV
jgi:hypothetical protein